MRPLNTMCSFLAALLLVLATTVTGCGDMSGELPPQILNAGITLDTRYDGSKQVHLILAEGALTTSPIEMVHDNVTGGYMASAQVYNNTLVRSLVGMTDNASGEISYYTPTDLGLRVIGETICSEATISVPVAPDGGVVEITAAEFQIFAYDHLVYASSASGVHTVKRTEVITGCD